MTTPSSMRTLFARTLISAALVVGLSAVSPTAGHAQASRHDRPNRVERADRGRAVIMDRSRANWWRDHRLFSNYRGPRRGHFYAPGYGYYPVPKGYSGRSFVAGAVVPDEMRRFVVTDPAAFGVTPAPRGHAWIFAGNNIALMENATGVIVRSVPGGW